MPHRLCCSNLSCDETVIGISKLVVAVPVCVVNLASVLVDELGVRWCAFFKTPSSLQILVSDTSSFWASVDGWSVSSHVSCVTEVSFCLCDRNINEAATRNASCCDHTKSSKRNHQQEYTAMSFVCSHQHRVSKDIESRHWMITFSSHGNSRVSSLQDSLQEPKSALDDHSWGARRKVLD